MFNNKSSINIKKERRKSLFLREISNIVYMISQNEPLLASVFPSRVDLSEGEGVCLVYFSAPSEEDFLKSLDVLKKYKGQIRTAIAQAKQSRYTPELVFKYDHILEKTQKIEALLNKAKEEDSKSNKN